jgi:hypothetical protein
MSIDRIAPAFGGAVVLLSLALAQLHSLYRRWLTAFVGANLLCTAFTGAARWPALPRPWAQNPDRPSNSR